MSILLGTEFQFCKMKEFWMYLMPLTCIFKKGFNGKFCVTCILPQLKKQPRSPSAKGAVGHLFSSMIISLAQLCSSIKEAQPRGGHQELGPGRVGDRDDSHEDSNSGL